LKNHVAHPHPNIFYLINLLKEQQASTEIKLIQYSTGGKRVPRKGKYVEIDNRLVNLKRRYVTTWLHMWTMPTQLHTYCIWSDF
jgi:hypothetical protein